MIFKLWSYKGDTAFKDAFAYIQKEEKRDRENGIEYFHILRSDQPLIEQFEHNDKVFRTRAARNRAMGGVISTHPRDAAKVTPQIMETLIEWVMEHIFADYLCYAITHHDTRHRHAHFIASAAGAGIHNHMFRLGKWKELIPLQHQLALFAKERFPRALSHTIQAYEKGRAAKMTNREYKLRQRTGNEKPTRKDQLAQVVCDCYVQSPDLVAFARVLAEQGIDVYTRGTSGRLTGVVAGGRKWRFRTLSQSLEEAIRRQEELTALRVRKREEPVLERSRERSYS